MLDVLLLALALSMDAFAVSIGLGAKNSLNPLSLAFMAAIYFGVFQGVMPLIGYLAGIGIIDWVGSYANWLAFTLLVLIGTKMIYESLSEGIGKDIAQITPRVMLILALATSIDALAAGFTLTLIDINPFLACLIIGLVTSLFSFIGVFFGHKSGEWLESKAELCGGIILVLIGIKILLM
ncbi:MAG: putative Mn2+ efflux pump MntP [Paraglaciecola sp.]|jgi:putative Mn2+ efflux pump MntP